MRDKISAPSLEQLSIALMHMTVCASGSTLKSRLWEMHPGGQLLPQQPSTVHQHCTCQSSRDVIGVSTAAICTAYHHDII